MGNVFDCRCFLSGGVGECVALANHLELVYFRFYSRVILECFHDGVEVASNISVVGEDVNVIW